MISKTAHIENTFQIDKSEVAETVEVGAEL
jgi:hypothetical protein